MSDSRLSVKKEEDIPLSGVAMVHSLDEQALAELCEATALAVADGEDIAWVTPPKQNVLEAYWKGILLAPHRRLFLAWHDGRICGATQLILPGTINEAGKHAGEIVTFFVAPWARGHGYARKLLERAEEEAVQEGLMLLDFSIRADRRAGIRLVESMGYERWAEKPRYAHIGNAFHKGYFYSRVIQESPPQQCEES